MAPKPQQEIKCAWLQMLVFKAGLFDHASLTANEQQALVLFLRECQSLQQVATNMQLTTARASQLLDNAVGKLLLAVKNMITRENLLDSVVAESKKLKQELSLLKTLHDTKPVPASTETITPILVQNCRLSNRAKKVLEAKQITYVAELATLSKEKLRAIPRVGIRTFDEIITFAEDCGIRIR